MPAVNPTEALAAFAADMSWDRLPPSAALHVKDLILDALADAFLGWKSDEASPFAATLSSLGPGDAATIIGGGRASPAAATAVNGYLITAVTMCDIHRPTSCHVMPEVLPPALATAEMAGSSGRDLLLAVAVGAEITTRVGLALRTEVFRGRGWHMPGISGPFGGAAALGRLLGLDRQGMSHALGIAGSQATGSYAQLRTPAIKFQQARGALAGLLAGQFAAAGLRAAQDILLHPDGGVLRTHSDGGNPAAAVHDLSEHWELEQISLRPWPVAVHLQTLVTALLELASAEPCRGHEIAGVQVELSAEAYDMHGRVAWTSPFLGRLSARYVTGVVLQDRTCGLAQFDPSHLQDEVLGTFVRDHVVVVANRDLAGSSVRVTVRTADGNAYVQSSDAAKGDPRNPLSHYEVETKFLDAAKPAVGVALAERIAGLVSHLEEVSRVDELTACMAGN